MTTADVLGLGKVATVVDADVGHKAASDVKDAQIESFSCIMNQMQLQNPGTEPTVSDNTKDIMAQSTEKQDAFDKFQSKESNISKAKTESEKGSEEREEQVEALSEFKEELVQEVANKTEVDEDTVQEAMEMLGLTIADLVDPQNLAKLYIQLKGEMESADLLVDSDFQELLQSVQELTLQVMDTLQVEEPQLVDLLQQMELTDSTETEFEPLLQMEMLIEQPDAELTETSPVMETEQALVSEIVTQADTEDEVNETPVIMVAEDKDAEAKEKDLEEKPSKEVDLAPKQEKPSSVNHMEKKGQEHSSENNEAFAQNQELSTEADYSSTTSTFSTTTNLTEMIDKLAESVRIAVSTETQTMELQLNPENLGKLFLQVTQKEGAVSAQITASNEAVRDALLAQVAALQEKLNQAGVKVDAIEVTVSAHEFERNLEQDQKREEQNAASDKKRNGRKSINLNELDELSGLMSEEEMLVAQMMKDNGNSVDLTA